MSATVLTEFLQTLQKACLPGVWSKGVALARDGAVQVDSSTEAEIILRVKVPDRVASPKVTLWPEDEDYFCTCDDRADPCMHVAAAVAALKNGARSSAAPETASASAPARSSAKGKAPAVSTRPVETPSENSLRYRFVRDGRKIFFERWLGKNLFEESLVSFVGGVGSGRIARPRIVATQEDFAIDQAMGPRRGMVGDRLTFSRLFPVLRSVSGIQFAGAPVQVGNPSPGLSVEVRKENHGFRVIGVQDPAVTEIFENGVLLCGSTFRLIEDAGLTATEREWLASPGKWFSPAEMSRLITEIVPSLEKKIPVKILTPDFPRVSHDPPRVILRLDKTGDHTLSVSSSITYASEYSVKDPAAERALLRKLQAELFIVPGYTVEFRGMAALDFIRRAQGWEMTGPGVKAFTMESALTPKFSVSESGFELEFESTGGSVADTDDVIEAWKEGHAVIPLLGGGYAPLPSDWLNRFGSRINRLLAAKSQDPEEKVPAYMKPELAAISMELGEAVPDPLLAFRRMLENFERIPEAKLPDDLQVTLRHYQQQGVNWLCFLRESGLGALLADDMGLGKTLQALCVIQGKTLVVCPTSVIHSWAEQARKFRPSLRIGLFHGPNRKFDPKADLVLTSYGLLRQERELLLKQKWDTAILDEAQTIKNPESQIAQVAHQLRAKFRMTLSGTPVENSMEDLWSQFQYLNPGLLGSRGDFQNEFASPISKGDPEATRRLRSQIKPFVLRRMKKEVAPELPPRTEVVRHCELSPAEQDLYDALLASGREEVLEALAKNESIFSALELLLRLRQACCHPSLVPGQKAETSSKLELLAQTLESTVAQGHRALVFSQWTSFLDLIGPRLEKMGLNYLRLDGSTANRQGVVQKFQDPKGPPVMLISLKAGGVGLTLTAADHVFLMDSWWNPAVEDQAADRAHRIGQENPVLVCRLIARNTLEERILALQKQKQELAGSVLDGSGQSVSLTREDILALLSPSVSNGNP